MWVLHQYCCFTSIGSMGLISYLHNIGKNAINIPWGAIALVGVG